MIQFSYKFYSILSWVWANNIFPSKIPSLKIPSNKKIYLSKSIYWRIFTIFSSNSVGENGFDKYSFAPMFKASISFDKSSEAVKNIMGTDDSVLMLLHNCNPSMFGRITSRTIRSGFSLPKTFRASLPLVAEHTV